MKIHWHLRNGIWGNKFFSRKGAKLQRILYGRIAYALSDEMEMGVCDMPLPQKY
jgi:hypothetical protein